MDNLTKILINKLQDEIIIEQLSKKKENIYLDRQKFAVLLELDLSLSITEKIRVIEEIKIRKQEQIDNMIKELLEEFYLIERVLEKDEEIEKIATIKMLQ